MFEFRLINTADGNQIVDRKLKTPYEMLTPLQMIEYIDMDEKILFMDRMERKAREERERKEKKWHNPFSHFIKKNNCRFA